jgi:predicted HD superfamily hydrolase involved in NAD metabolism
MTIDEALDIVKKKNEKRFKHVYGTYECATYLAKKYNINEYKCQLAAILHDYAKNEPIEYLKEIILNHLDPSELQYDDAIFHGIVGAYLVREQFNIEDEDILNAISYHVTGHPLMNDVAKIVYIADYIEVNRTHEGVKFARYLSEINLDLAVVGIAEKTLQFLLDANIKSIHPLSLETYNKFLEKVGALYYDTIKYNYKSMR